MSPAEHKQLHHDNAERSTFRLRLKTSLKWRWSILLLWTTFILYLSWMFTFLFTPSSKTEPSFMCIGTMGISSYTVFVSICPKVNISCLARVKQQKTRLLTLLHILLKQTKFKFDQHVPLFHCLVLMFLLISTLFYLSFWTPNVCKVMNVTSVLSLWILHYAIHLYICFNIYVQLCPQGNTKQY